MTCSLWYNCRVSTLSIYALILANELHFWNVYGHLKPLITRHEIWNHQILVQAQISNFEFLILTHDLILLSKIHFCFHSWLHLTLNLFALITEIGSQLYPYSGNSLIQNDLILFTIAETQLSNAVISIRIILWQHSFRKLTLSAKRLQALALIGSLGTIYFFQLSVWSLE